MDGTKLKILRESLGLNQGEIAFYLGVNNETVCRWERGGVELKKMASEALDRLASDPEEVSKLRGMRHQLKMERRRKRLKA
jgi:DNA-binding transcriptional regulator YiaG